MVSLATVWKVAVITTLCYHGVQTEPLDVVISNESLSVSVGAIKLISHTKVNPMVYVGRGTTTFSNYRGNCRIEDYVEERIGLADFTTTQEDNDVIATFSDGIRHRLEIRIGATQGHQLTLTFGKLPQGYERVWLRLPADVNEHVYGGGEQFTSFDLRGRTYPLWTGEQGVGRDKKYPITLMADAMEGGAGGDYYSTYFPQPTFFSSRHYYCHVAGSTYMNLDFSHENFHEIFILGQPEAVYFGADQSMMGLVGQLNGFLGRQPELPEWVNDGVILGMQGGTQRMLELLDVAETNGVKVSGLWIQDWSGKLMTSFGKRVYWDWRWDPEQYPDLVEEIARLREKGVRVLVYINPHLISEGSLFAEADSQGYLMRNPQGGTYLQDFGEYDCGSVDFTNPDAYQWYKGVIIRNVMDLGIRGWMADFSEYIPDDAVFFDGQTGATMHNRYPVLWAKVNHEAVKDANLLGEAMFFMRAGGSGTSGHSTLMWAGDQNVDWSLSDGLATTLPAALSLAVSGVGLTHYDIGGYTTVVRQQSIPGLDVSVNMVRSEELFFRGAEAAVFTAAMRTHEGNIPQANYQVYNKAEDLQRFAVFVNMFRALKPYTRAAILEYQTTGTPLQRPMFLQYEEEPATFDLQYQYMFGSDLLVAPVITPGVSDQWKVYLPDDDWVYLYDATQEYRGPREVVIPAPLGRVPVFYRKGSPWTEVFQVVADIAITGVVDNLGQCDKESCGSNTP